MPYSRQKYGFYIEYGLFLRECYILVASTITNACHIIFDRFFYSAQTGEQFCHWYLNLDTSHMRR